MPQKSVDIFVVATYKFSMTTYNDNLLRLADEIHRTFDSLEEEVLLSLMMTHKNLKGELDRLFKEHGTSGPQYESLKIINENGKEGTPVRKIAERMVSDQPDVTRIIDRLEASGFAERVRGTDDRRVVFVRITREGKRFMRKLDKPVSTLHKDQFTHLKKTELKLLNRLLSKTRYVK